MLESVLEKAECGAELTKSDLLELLAVETGSREYYKMLWLANRDARRRFSGRGRIYAQIGLNASPCPANCAFCALAKDVFEAGSSFKLTLPRIKATVAQLAASGVDEIFLMTTADYDAEDYLSCGRAARSEMPENMRLVANVGDFDLDYAIRLKDAGFTGAYHIRRLGEGKDTLLAPELRINTLNAIRGAGLELYYCVEPIGPEHSYAEIADEICRGRDYGADVMAVMKRVCVPNTRLYERGEISAAELAKICAATELCVRPLRAMGVHEPDELCLMAGANQIYAEISANPRDVNLSTEHSRGASVERAAQLLKLAEWQRG